MFKNREIYFVSLNVDSFLPKIDKFYHLAKLRNTSVICISETKLNGSVLIDEVAVEGSDLIRIDNRGTETVCVKTLPIKHTLIYIP